jgi:hypothetical protein
MSDNSQEILSSFMKKQISKKAKKSSSEVANKSFSDDKEKNFKNPESKEEEEKKKQLEEAKKEAINQARNSNQAMMIRKLMIQNIVKFFAIMLVLVLVFITLVEVVPSSLRFINVMIHKFFINSVK